MTPSTVGAATPRMKRTIGPPTSRGPKMNEAGDQSANGTPLREQFVSDP